MKASNKPRRNNKITNLVLEEIIGLTTKNSNGLASNTSTSYCVYPAGSVAVVYDVVSRTQSHLVVKHRAPKPLSCVTVSLDGNFVGAGESGTQPAVLVWDYAARTCIAELKSHHFGVASVAFSPDGQLLASVGFPRDDSICLWHWRSKMLQTRIKACSPSSPISSISFSSKGKFIVTAGNKHLNVWDIKGSKRAHSKTKAVTFALHRKPINLVGKRGLSFVSAISIHGSTYALTDTGSLCLLQSDFSAMEVVNLMVEKGFALAASSKLIACACSGGIIKLFDVIDLSHAGNLYYSEATNCQDERNSVSSGQMADKNYQPKHTQPDALACQFLNLQNLVVVYSDHSLYVWDIDDKYKATRCCVLVSHVDCIMDIKALPCEYKHDPSTACVARGCSGGVSFTTCSADGIIRLWDVEFQPVQLDNAKETHFENHLTKINSVGSTCLVSTGTFERDIIELGNSTQGFRSMAVSSDGNQLAVGDCQGSLCIYHLNTHEYLCLQDAHGAEILSLSFSLPCKMALLSEETPRNHYFLASGSRDGMIHIFDADRNFILVASIDDHSAAVTSVKLSSSGRKIISCSADGSVILRDIVVRGGTFQITCCQHLIASQGIVYDMATDPNLEFAISVGKDKKIKTFDLLAGKLLRTCKQYGEFGDPIKISMDPSYSYLLCSYTNKSICVYESRSGEMVAQAVGHGQLITAAIFLPDGKRIVSADGEGCLFIWKIPPTLCSRMLQKSREIFGLVSPRKTIEIAALSQFKFSEEDNPEPVTDCKKKIIPGIESPVGQGLLNQDRNSHFGSTFKFSISRLPTWARSKITSLDTVPVENVSSSSQTEPEEMPPLVINEASCDTDNSNQHGGEPSTSENSSDSEDGKDSPVTEETHTFSTGKGKQWHTIYNVCLDHLSSPDIWGSIDKKIPIKRFNIGNPTMKMPSDGEKQIPVGSNIAISHPCQSSVQPEINDIHADQHVDPNDKSNSVDKCILHKDFAEQHHIDQRMCCDSTKTSEEQRLDVGASMDIEDPHMVPCDDDVFNQHFGNLSSNFKLEGKRSSAKRSYSARFVVKRNHVQGFMNLTNDCGFETFNSGERTSSKVVPLNLEGNEAL